MRKLERALGTAIWLREGRTLQLTQAGEHLLEAASHILPQLEHAEQGLQRFARGARGPLRIGMECHPCYQWLLKVAADYMPRWPDVDVDVKQKFRFGGIDALLDHEIDLLVTPDPEPRPGLRFEPVFDYEQVLVVSRAHPLAEAHFVEPGQLRDEVLITYPVETDRLDVYTHVPEAGRGHAAPAQGARIHRPDAADGGGATAASPRCRAGWWRSTCAAWPSCRCGSAGMACRSRFTWARARPTPAPATCARSSRWRAPDGPESRRMGTSPPRTGTLPPNGAAAAGRPATMGVST